MCWKIVSEVEGSATRCSKYNSHDKIKKVYEYDTEYRDIIFECEFESSFGENMYPFVRL